MRVALDTAYASKPPQFAQINRAHPLAQGLRGFWLLPDGGGVPVDAVSGTAASLQVGTAAPTPAATSLGLGMKWADTNSQYLLGNLPQFQPLFPFSLFGVAVIANATQSHALICTDNTTSVFAGAMLYVDTGHPSLQFSDATSNANTHRTLWQSTASLAPTPPILWVISGSMWGTPASPSAAIYANGIPLAASFVFTGATVMAYSSGSASIGGTQARTPNNTGDVKLCAAIWNRVLSPAEHMQLAKQPFCMFTDRPMVQGPLGVVIPFVPRVSFVS